MTTKIYLPIIAGLLLAPRLGQKYISWRSQSISQLVNEANISTLAPSRHLDYQIIEDGAVSYSTNPNLPKLQIISVKETVMPGVLGTAIDSPPQILPYVVWDHYRPFLVIPISNKYLLFSKLL